MVPIFTCGWECGVMAVHWTAVGSPSISTSTVRSGARSLRVNPTAAVQGVTQTYAASNVLVARVYVRFATLSATVMPLLTVNVGGSPRCGAYFNSADSKIYAARSTITLGATGVSVVTGQWYCVDVGVDTHANPWLVEVRVDGVACGSAGVALAANTYTLLALGDADSTKTHDLFFDDLVLSQTFADYPIGGGYVNHFVPTADGTHNIAGTADFTRTLTGTDILNATTTAYQLIDDAPLESGASVDWINLVAPPNATDYVECIYGPASGISTPTVAPRAVEVIAGYHQAGTTVGNMEIRLNDNGTNNTVYTATAVAGVTSVAYARKHYATAPTGGAWTVVSGAGNFNNLRVRFGSPAAVDANPDQYLDCTMIEAEFADPTGPPVGVLYKNTRAGASAIQRASRW